VNIGDRVIVKGVGLGTLLEVRVNFSDVEMDEFPRDRSTYMNSDIEVRNDLPKAPKKERRIMREDRANIIYSDDTIEFKTPGIYSFNGEKPMFFRTGDTYDISRFMKGTQKITIEADLGGCDDLECDCHEGMLKEALESHARGDTLARGKPNLDEARLELRKIIESLESGKGLKGFKIQNGEVTPLDLEQGRRPGEKLLIWKFIGQGIAMATVLWVVLKILNYLAGLL